MKLKSLLLCSFLGLSLFAQAETVHVSTAGSLKTLVDTTGRVIDDLTLTGSVNRSDLLSSQSCEKAQPKGCYHSRRNRG